MTVYDSSGTFRNVPLLLSHACLCAGRFDTYDAYETTGVVAANGNIQFACAVYGPISCKSRENDYCGVRRGAQRTNNFEVIEND